MLADSAFDKEGFLRSLEDWTPQVAEQIAAGEAIALTDAHWEIIDLLRQYYREFDSSPATQTRLKCCSISSRALRFNSLTLTTG